MPPANKRLAPGAAEFARLRQDYHALLEQSTSSLAATEALLGAVRTLLGDKQASLGDRRAPRAADVSPEGPPLDAQRAAGESPPGAGSASPAVPSPAAAAGELSSSPLVATNLDVTRLAGGGASASAELPLDDPIDDAGTQWAETLRDARDEPPTQAPLPRPFR